MKGKAGYNTVLTRGEGFAVDLSAKDPAKLPKRMKVLNWGENPNARGKRVFVGPRLGLALSAPTYPFRKAPLDFEHNTLPGTPAYAESQEPRAVAGFFSVEVIEGEGVFVTMLNWTPTGLENAANYCDLSAAAVRDTSGEVLAIPSVALCRCGAVEGMDFLEVPLSADAVAALSAITTTPMEEDVNWKQMICQALGLDPEKASDEEVAGKLKETLGAVNATALNASIETAVGAALKPLKDQVVALNAAGEKRDKERVLDMARWEGKVVALNADAIDKLSVSDLQAHVAALSVTVPLDQRTPSKVKEPTGDAGPTEEQRTIALNCGMDPEKVFAKR